MPQPSKPPAVTGTESKGHPDNGRERTEVELEKGLPPNQRRGPQDKSDPRPAPDKSPQGPLGDADQAPGKSGG